MCIAEPIITIVFHQNFRFILEVDFILLTAQGICTSTTFGIFHFCNFSILEGFDVLDFSSASFFMNVGSLLNHSVNWLSYFGCPSGYEWNDFTCIILLDGPIELNSSSPPIHTLSFIKNGCHPILKSSFLLLNFELVYEGLIFQSHRNANQRFKHAR